MTALLARTKFRAVMTARYPILLVDEYQDTDAGFVDALKQYFLDTGTGPVVGLFGDPWQKIYGEGCGAVDHAAPEVIDKDRKTDVEGQSGSVRVDIGGRL